MKKKITIGVCIALALGILFRPQLTHMKDKAEAKLFLSLSGIRIVLDAGHGGIHKYPVEFNSFGL